MLVAPIISNLSSLLVDAPSTCVINSVFNRRDASCSFSFRVDMMASISSKNMTLGCFLRATVNNAFINFSPSPIYFDVTLDDVMLKNVNPDSVATALASNVFPVPTPIKGYYHFDISR